MSAEGGCLRRAAGAVPEGNRNLRAGEAGAACPPVPAGTTACAGTGMAGGLPWWASVTEI